MLRFEDFSQPLLQRLEVELPPWFTYHDVRHTMYVIERTHFIGLKEGISKNDIFLAKLGALYHDTGFLIQREEHEKVSCKIATRELEKHGINNPDLEKICGIIMATKIPQRPKSLAQKIVADADLNYLGTDHFSKFSNNLYREYHHFNPNLTPKEWDKIQVEFISNHTYHTDFCRTYLEPVKLENLEKVKERLAKFENG